MMITLSPKEVKEALEFVKKVNETNIEDLQDYEERQRELFEDECQELNFND